jgi:hypothetical protein
MHYIIMRNGNVHNQNSIFMIMVNPKFMYLMGISYKSFNMMEFLRTPRMTLITTEN